MLYQQTITERSIQKLSESGLSVSVAAEASYDGAAASASVSAEANLDTASTASDTETSSEFEVKIFVFGGIPPASGANTDAGFSEWSETVHDMPMPVSLSHDQSAVVINNCSLCVFVQPASKIARVVDVCVFYY